MIIPSICYHHRLVGKLPQWCRHNSRPLTSCTITSFFRATFGFGDHKLIRDLQQQLTECAAMRAHVRRILQGGLSRSVEREVKWEVVKALAKLYSSCKLLTPPLLQYVRRHFQSSHSRHSLVFHTRFKIGRSAMRMIVQRFFTFKSYNSPLTFLFCCNLMMFN